MSANKQVRIAQAIAGKSVLEESALTEDFKLGKPDKRVIVAFTDQKKADGKHLDTDGKTLNTSGMGGGVVAFWGSDDKIYFRDLGGKSSDVIHRAIKKEAPKNDIGGYKQKMESIEEAPLNEAQKAHYAVDGNRSKGTVYADTQAIRDANNVVHYGYGDFGGEVGGIEVHFSRIDTSPLGNALMAAGFVGRPHLIMPGLKSKKAHFGGQDVAKAFKDSGAKLVKYKNPPESSSKSESLQEQIANFRAPVEEARGGIWSDRKVSMKEVEGLIKKQGWLVVDSKDLDGEYYIRFSLSGTRHKDDLKPGDRRKTIENFVKKNKLSAFEYGSDGSGYGFMSFEKAQWTESIEEAAPIDQRKLLALYDRLKKGDRVDIVFDSSMRKGKNPRTFVVTSPHRVVGKAKVGRIIFKDAENLKGVKYFWYNRDGRISMAQGDMAVSIVSAEKSTNESFVDEEGNPWMHKYVDGKPRLVKRSQDGKKWVGKAPATLPVPPMKAKKESDEDEPMKQDPRFLTHGQSNYALIGQMLSEANEIPLFEQPDPGLNKRWINDGTHTKAVAEKLPLPRGWKEGHAGFDEAQAPKGPTFGPQDRADWGKAGDYKPRSDGKKSTHAVIVVGSKSSSMRMGTQTASEPGPPKVAIRKLRALAKKWGAKSVQTISEDDTLAVNVASLTEAKSERQIAQGMKKKGYTHILLRADGGDALYAKSVKMAKSLQADHKDKKFTIRPIGDYLSESALTEASRPLHQIAAEIEKAWKKVNFAARPYLDAMHSMDSIRDNYGADPGSSIVTYFLANARSFTGPEAKAIKKELNKMLKESEDSSDNIQEQVSSFREVVESRPFEEQKEAFRASIDESVEEQWYHISKSRISHDADGTKRVAPYKPKRRWKKGNRNWKTRGHRREDIEEVLSKDGSTEHAPYDGQTILVYDNGGKTMDRYTIFVTYSDGTKAVFGMSDNPDSPQGFNQYVGDGRKEKPGSHLGRKLRKIPKKIQHALDLRASEERREPWESIEEGYEWAAKDAGKKALALFKKLTKRERQFIINFFGTTSYDNPAGGSVRADMANYEADLRRAAGGYPNLKNNASFSVFYAIPQKELFAMAKSAPPADESLEEQGWFGPLTTPPDQPSIDPGFIAPPPPGGWPDIDPDFIEKPPLWGPQAVPMPPYPGPWSIDPFPGSGGGGSDDPKWDDLEIKFGWDF
jgi:hypothetical protein